jgi:hypothetical protein
LKNINLINNKSNIVFMATEIVTLHVVLPVIVGLIVGIIEAYFVYEDENMTSGRDFLGDMWHGLIFSVLFVLLASNVPWVLTQGWFPSWITGLLYMDELGRSLVVSILISLLAMTKMVASHAIRGVAGNGFREKFWHKIVISAAIGFAPYYIFPLYSAGFLAGLAEALPWVPF